MNKFPLAAAAILATATAASAADTADGKSDFQGFYAGLVGGLNQFAEGYDPAWGVGVTLGYNWDVSNGFILGLEGDLMGGGWEGLAYANDSIRLRAGYDLNGLLVYGTAGYGATGFGTGNTSVIGAGFVGGGGLEYMLGHGVSVKAEGLYRAETDSVEVRSGFNFNF